MLSYVKRNYFFHNFSDYWKEIYRTMIIWIGLAPFRMNWYDLRNMPLVWYKVCFKGTSEKCKIVVSPGRWKWLWEQMQVCRQEQWLFTVFNERRRSAITNSFNFIWFKSRMFLLEASEPYGKDQHGQVWLYFVFVKKISKTKIWSKIWFF